MKNKVLKCFSIMAMALIFTMFIPNNAKAQTVQNEGIKINFGEINFSIPDYTEDEVVVKVLADNKVNIIDKETGAILETVTCVNIPENSPKLDKIKENSLNDYGNEDTFYYGIQRDKTDALATVRLEVVVVLYRSGSFSSIQSIEGQDMFIISSSFSTLENVSTYARSVSGTFPSTNIEYYGSGVITITTEITSGSELAIGFSIKEVTNLGYSVNPWNCGFLFLKPSP